MACMSQKLLKFSHFLLIYLLMITSLFMPVMFSCTKPKERKVNVKLKPFESVVFCAFITKTVQTKDWLKWIELKWIEAASVGVNVTPVEQSAGGRGDGEYVQMCKQA